MARDGVNSTNDTNDRRLTLSEKRQVRLMKKENNARLKRREEARKRKARGKPEKEEDLRPQTIWEKLAEERLYPQLREMGDSYKSIDKFQRGRILKAIIFALLTMVLAAFVHSWFYFATPIVGFVSYKMQIKKVDNYYRAWRFERQLNFSKFQRLVIPYLKASGGNMALYTIFNRILQRLENDADKVSLYRLMGEMSDNPSDIQPFLNYAERSSGTDMSHLFMSTIFDFQQSTFNTDVIDELGKIASEDMMNSIDEIIQMKLRRFVMFPTKMVMTSFILVVGLGAGLLFYNLKDINITGGGLSAITDPPSATEQGIGDDLSDDGMDIIIDDEVDESEEDSESEAEALWYDNIYDELDDDSIE